jgi:hypothetical protein
MSSSWQMLLPYSRLLGSRAVTPSGALHLGFTPPASFKGNGATPGDPLHKPAAKYAATLVDSLDNHSTLPVNNHSTQFILSRPCTFISAHLHFVVNSSNGVGCQSLISTLLISLAGKKNLSPPPHLAQVTPLPPPPSHCYLIIEWCR